ncbi:hypothetical protein PMAYCL1PPCAC_28195, partial [Pristionchus mayeri]
ERPCRSAIASPCGTIQPQFDERQTAGNKEGDRELDGSLDYGCVCGAQFDLETDFTAHMMSHKLTSVEELSCSETNFAMEVDHSYPEQFALHCSRYFAEWRGNRLHCSICDHASNKLQQHIEHVAAEHPTIKAQFEFLCRVCKNDRFLTEFERDTHEKTCPDMQLLHRRQAAASVHSRCPWCTLASYHSQLAGHLLVEHADILQRLRKCGSQVSQLLPFRCSKCLVGFEDTRVLEHHWRARELLGIPCRGELIVYNYQRNEKVTMPDTPTELRYLPMGDPPPFLPALMDVHRLEKCESCNEMWPVGQMQLHVKYDHPWIFYQKSPRKCKKCKQAGFYSTLQYIDHSQVCTGRSPPSLPSSHPAVAPRNCIGTAPRIVVLPEEADTQIRRCRLCPLMLIPLELMLHAKEEHALRHFTDAPYPCLRCGEVAFHRHEEYKIHSLVCDASRLSRLADDLYAVVLNEAEMRENVDADFSTYRSCFDDVRKRGTLTCLDWKQRCGLCPATNSHSDFLRYLSMHMLSSHFAHQSPIVCMGCGVGFRYVAALSEHATKQNNLGNAQCFNMGRIFRNPAKAAGKINLFDLRNGFNNNEIDADSLLVAYWKKLLQLGRQANGQPSSAVDHDHLLNYE